MLSNIKVILILIVFFNNTVYSQFSFRKKAILNIDIEQFDLNKTQVINNFQIQNKINIVYKPKINFLNVINRKDTKRNKLVDIATKLIGIKFVYGGNDSNGFDCSSFVQYVYKKAGIKVPRNSYYQSKIGKKINLKDAKKGDLIFYGHKTKRGYKTSHVGIVYSNDKGNFSTIHCVNRGVTIDKEKSRLWLKYWKKRVLFVKKII